MSLWINIQFPLLLLGVSQATDTGSTLVITLSAYLPYLDSSLTPYKSSKDQDFVSQFFTHLSCSSMSSQTNVQYTLSTVLGLPEWFSNYYNKEKFLFISGRYTRAWVTPIHAKEVHESSISHKLVWVGGTSKAAVQRKPDIEAMVEYKIFRLD